VKKTTTILMGLALSATIAVAQDKPAPAAPATPAAPAAATAAEADPVIMAAGSLTIHKSEFENALKTLPAEYQQYAQGPGKKQFAEDYLRMKMLSAEGYKNGLESDPEVVQQLSVMRDNLVANAQLQKIDKTVSVSDDDLKKVYEANKKDYEQVKARHILVAFKGSPAAPEGKTPLTEEQAKAKAEDIRKQLLAGAKFEDLAKKESDDTGSGARGGELGSFGHGQMVPEFEQAAFAAKVGEITPVIRTQFGYHIIKVDEHNTTPFEEVKPALEKKEHQKALQAALDAMKAKASPTFNEAYFGPAEPPAAAAVTAAPPNGAKSAKPADSKKPGKQ
jgi:peptidyl-prolyl cis-trans isomerase C